MRFLHAADLHLGLRVTRFGAHVNGRVQEARIAALDRLIQVAKAKSVDFVLIAGDLFDDNQVDLGTRRRALELFASVGRPVYIISGNHDPYTSDSVFLRTPWATASAENVRLLSVAEYVDLPGGVLYPCPLFAKNSLDDPTRWIPLRDAGDSRIRIALAHGSLNDRPNLPPDDHLIDPGLAIAKGLDYVALGHWHGPYRRACPDGVIRTVYPGVPEPMRFKDAPEFVTGWSAYSNTNSADLFADDGEGRALLVSIAHAGAAPVLEEIKTGTLDWRDETRALRNEDDLSALIDELAHRENRLTQLLRLHLTGTLPANALLRLDELDQSLAGGQGGVLTQYCWFELDTERLYAEPTDAELCELAGTGVVRAVYDRLNAEAASAQPETRAIAREALLCLYRYAQEVRQ